MISPIAIDIDIDIDIATVIDVVIASTIADPLCWFKLRIVGNWVVVTGLYSWQRACRAILIAGFARTHRGYGVVDDDLSESNHQEFLCIPSNMPC